MITLRNNVTLIGNMGTDARITKFENGNQVVRFNLATNKEYRANNGKTKSSTEWHRLFAWGNIGQFIEKFGEKGKKVAVHGRLVNRTYYSAEGIKRTVTEVEVRHILGL